MAPTLVSEVTKRCDILVEELFVSSSRGDRTPIELFVAGTTALNVALLRHFTGGPRSKP